MNDNKVFMDALREVSKTDKEARDILDPWRNSCEKAMILKRHPELAQAFDWKELDCNDQIDLLCSMPRYLDKCDVDKFSGNHWAKLLAAQPQLADICPWDRFDGYAWATLLEKQPQFAEKCDWAILNESNRKVAIEGLKRSAKGLDFVNGENIVNASDIFGDNDDDDGDDPGDFDTFFSDEEDDKDESPSDTWGGETIINLNFDDK